MKWIFAAVILAAAAWGLRLGLLVYAAYVVLGLLGVSRLFTRAWIRALSAERTGEGGAKEIGDRFQMTVTVRHSGRWSIPWLLLEDRIPWEALRTQPPGLRLEGAWARLVALKGGETARLEYEGRFERRGYFQFGPLLAETGDLFGLHRAYRLLSDPCFVTVHPRVLALEGYDIGSPRPLGEIRLAHRLFEDATRINGVKPYEPGDPLNRIHWRASARTGALQSKTFESSCVAGATLVLDFHQEAYPAPGTYYCSELAVTLTATLANALAGMGQPVGLVTNGRDASDRMKYEGWDARFSAREAARKALAAENSNWRLTPLVVETRREPDVFPRILETLARLELSEEFAFPHLLREAGPRIPRSATAIAILSGVNAETAGALGALRRRGHSVLALVVLYGERDHPNWAAPPEWAGHLLQEGIPFRRIADEASAAAFCSEQCV